MTQSRVITIKLSRRTWYALKRVMAYTPPRLAPSAATFGALVDAIGDGDDELLMMWRKAMAEAAAEGM
jgi:hypothetical protein